MASVTSYDRVNYLQSAVPKIFNFDESFDVNVFDELTASFYHGQGAENEFAKKVLEEFLQDERSWCRVDAILEHSKSDESRFYALLVLEKLVRSRWKLLPSEQRVGIRDYIVQQIILIGSNSDMLEARKLYLNKLCCCLVEILKNEWPKRWPEFLDEVVQSSKINDSICLVNMKILRLLSEEVFQFSSNMNHIKTQHLKKTLLTQFPPLFHHIYNILSDSTNVLLIIETLKALHGFMPYVSTLYVFDSGIIDILIERLFKEPMFTNDTLNCLAEIMNIDSNEADKHKNSIYLKILNQVKQILPADFDFNLAFVNGTDVQQNYLRMLSVFFTQSLRNYHRLYSSSSDCQMIVDGLSYIMAATKINDAEIFKICVEFWVTFTGSVRIDKSRSETRSDNITRILIDSFKSILTNLRYIIITNMKRPEEVIIFVDENGDVVRQVMRDTDSVNIYNFCKDTLSNLTYLNPEEIRDIILERFDAVMHNPTFVWNDLNCLGWAVGSISGAMSVEMERDFIVRILRCLLTLCDEKSGKNNKAIIASNIMYVVQQYPRFLKPYYRFLKTVANKLFEFMSETHEGVQDMATDAFLKISRSCKYQLGKVQPDESVSYIEDILNSIPNLILLLNINQLQIMFEALGQIVSAIEDSTLAQNVICCCLSRYFANWTKFVTSIKSLPPNTNVVYESFSHELNDVSVFLKVCTSMCKSVGSTFEPMISKIFQDGLTVFTFLSNAISKKILTHGLDSAMYSDVKAVRSTKRDFLNLIICFVNSCHENLDALKSKYFVPFTGVVLVDYFQSPSVVKEAEVLSATTAFITTMKSRMNEHILIIFQQLFDPTMSMISADLQDYPEHRLNFFKLIESITSCCFNSLVQMSPTEFDFVMQALFYGISHTTPSISAIGLTSIITIFKNLIDHSYADGTFITRFHTTYFVPIFDRILHLFTDKIHSADLGEHSFLLSHMINLIENDKIKAPLNEQIGKFVSNKIFVKEHAILFLKQQYEHLTEQQLSLFVQGLFCFYKNHDQFIQCLKDFLIMTGEYQGEDPEDLFADELQKEMSAVSQVPTFVLKGNDFHYQRSLHDYHTTS